MKAAYMHGFKGSLLQTKSEDRYIKCIAKLDEIILRNDVDTGCSL